MNCPDTNPSSRDANWRPLPVEWLESEATPVDLVGRVIWRPPLSSPVPRQRRICVEISAPRRTTPRAFTLLEMMIVVGIIGLLAAMALPHLKGFTSGSTMTGATRQLLDDINLARQRAIANRAEVCMVFLPAQFWNYIPSAETSPFSNNVTANLYFHQCSAYALIAMRTVGDQPGKSNAFYLTDWKTLPQGVFISPLQLTNPFVTNWVCTTNTLTIGPNGPLTNWFQVTGLPTNQLFPFPSISTNSWYSGVQYSNFLPYIAFTPTGQLVSGYDQYILLAQGAVIAFANAGGPTSAAWQNPEIEETPPGNDTNNPNIVHIDWLTGRTKLERNQF